MDGEGEGKDENDGYYIEPVSRADIARRRVSTISPSSARNEDT